ncbi:MAG: hypothetical protein QOF23_1860 [Solirubrobacterales bacterium]|jgi:hypothetical protein|nr:hypothetical protein [Solirubrobacterales bacterium]
MNEAAPDNGIPRGALIVVAIGLIACVVAAVASTSKGEGEAAQLEWVQNKPISDSAAVPVPGGKGQLLQITEAGLRATGTNVSGYSLYRSTATLRIDAGAPVGSARILCSMKAPGGTEVAQTPKSRASYPRSSEELSEQPVPEVVLVEFSSHSNELATVEFEDLFQNGFATEKEVKVEWPSYKVGDERWEWFLPPGPPKQSLELPFATVWKTTAVPAAEIACTLTTSAGKATVNTQGALPKRSEPIAE